MQQIEVGPVEMISPGADAPVAANGGGIAFRDDVFNEGRDAAMRGCSPAANPYLAQDALEEFLAWTDGFYAARG